MRCTSCQRNIAAGVEAAKMIVAYRQDDGGTRIFGYGMSDGTLATARGQMIKGWHHKCFHVERKRAARGDSVSGRVVAGTPTGYQISDLVLTKDDLAALGITEAEARSRSTLHLSASLTVLRTLAEQLGKGVGDATVQEAFQAAERGSPYAHQHHHRLDAYQLIAHLEYAHGLADIRLLRTPTGLQDQHAELHARSALDAIRSDRVADDEPEPRITDWRAQHTADIE